MKNVFFALALAALVSCSKDGGQSAGKTKETYIDATSKTTWHYYSLANNQVVGTGEQTAEDNAKWFGRTDWDIAVSLYNIRTNSGAATTAGASGGVYTCAAAVSFGSLDALPAGAAFTADKAVTSSGMGGVVTTIRSEATVILFKTDDNGDKIMPPVYLQAPVYVFRTAAGSGYFKVQFTQYQNEDKVSGHVKFYSSEIK